MGGRTAGYPAAGNPAATKSLTCDGLPAVPAMLEREVRALNPDGRIADSPGMAVGRAEGVSCAATIVAARITGAITAVAFRANTQMWLCVSSLPILGSMPSEDDLGQQPGSNYVAGGATRRLLPCQRLFGL